jgi:hypothetical protein
VPDESVPPKLKSSFFDVDAPSTQKLYRPPTLMRTTEWGGLTMLSLLASFLFPPYFLTVLTLAFLNAGGLFWVTHLSEKGRKALIDFEKEFRLGFEKEQAGKLAEARALYQSLIPKYHEFPKIAEIAQHRIDQLKAQAPTRSKSARKPGRTRKKVRT